MIVGIVAALGGWLVSLVGHGSKRDDLFFQHTTKLAERLDKLEKRNDEHEKRISQLEEDKRNDRGWIVRTINRVVEHDRALITLLLPWPNWYKHGCSDVPAPPSPDGT